MGKIMTKTATTIPMTMLMTMLMTIVTGLRPAPILLVARAAGPAIATIATIISILSLFLPLPPISSRPGTRLYRGQAEHLRAATSVSPHRRSDPRSPCGPIFWPGRSPSLITLWGEEAVSGRKVCLSDCLKKRADRLRRRPSDAVLNNQKKLDDSWGPRHSLAYPCIMFCS